MNKVGEMFQIMHKVHNLENFPYFYMPVEDGSYYVVPSVRLSVRMSVCPFVNFSCPLHNSDTVQDIFMKLGTNINHHQSMCREQEPTLHLHFLWNYGPLNFF